MLTKGYKGSRSDGRAVHLLRDPGQVTSSLRVHMFALFPQLRGWPRDGLTTLPVQMFLGPKLVSPPIPITSPASSSLGPSLIPRVSPSSAQSCLLCILRVKEGRKEETQPQFQSQTLTNQTIPFIAYIISRCLDEKLCSLAS